jgi:hypothetical protein
VLRGQSNESPTVINFGFLDRSRYFLEIAQYSSLADSSHGVFLFVCCARTHVRWIPCQHGMARPQVADGGDALQVAQGSCEYNK